MKPEEYIIDETSGIKVKNRDYEMWQGGYNQSLTDHEWDDNYYKGKKQGIREVVDFIEERLERYKVAPKLLGLTMLSEDWKEALKEWGDIDGR